ncbi:XRE family transcriptional regulator [Agrobacterium vitis]|uniref:XRE family transcriptional regulator n=1 Tax=Agrobacterium vitis TaxID=373 RepID=UPI003D29F373
MLHYLPNRQFLVKGYFAYLAMALELQTEHFCHMDKQYPNRLNTLREERGMTIEQVAEATGLSTSYVSRLENGDRNLSVKNLNLFAHALGVEPQEILIKSNEPKANVVAVMGRIGAGAEISPDEEQVPPDGLHEVETPFPIPDDALAFEVSGDSMWPRYDDGDIIICWSQSIIPEDVLGWEAAVRTRDGRRYLKRVHKGAEAGTYDLESHNAPPIRGVELVWVASIQSVIRSGQWKRAAPSERHRRIHKMISGR